ncbi:hypothetical protein TTHERM_00338410 (macronuclear) [Tetrahymena thermophila SB210]|uniref:Uncharacterized protein n=1 Tax=Tetrahymena thermophila (strain SB210) TaxID=312017 RepID=I7MK01_TETTS|nr:hypothetical protein TTHERM_00338410 [Tetrahymena thermophila SB210]EAR97360.2 hypothetical protein TTHERM_00338410 [Tetrahymena thermophila SB210]|eukprot:XP_001017605.2 hypothetical protein TTHERM_00338410 [Tetrahymena thermophila SB210]
MKFYQIVKLKRKTQMRPMSAQVTSNKNYQQNQQTQNENNQLNEKHKENHKNIRNNLNIEPKQFFLPSDKQFIQKVPQHPQSAKSYKSVAGQQHLQQQNFFQNNNEEANTLPLSNTQAQSNKFFFANKTLHNAKSSQTIGFSNTLMNIIDIDSTKSMKKLMPKNIKKAKEVLYEGTLIVKEKCNKLENENTKLKTQIIQLQKQNNKQQKLLYEIEQSQNSGQTTLLSQPAADNLLIMTLKKEQKILKDEINQKEAEIQSLKRSVRQTRIEELEIQLKCYIEETLRLKAKIDLMQREKQRSDQHHETSYQKEGKVFLLNQIVDKLKQENYELAAQLIQSQQRCQELEVRDEIDEKIYKRSSQIQKLQQQIQIQETLITEQQNKTKILEEELSKAKLQIQHYKILEQDYQTRLITEQQLLKKMEHQELHNQDLEAKLAALELEYQENQKKHQQEKQQLQIERDNYQEQAQNGKYKNPGERIVEKQTKNYQNYQYPSSLSHIEEDEDMFLRTKNGYVRTLQEINREKEIYERQNAKKRSYKTVAPVSTDQISEVCKTINNKLSLKKISIDTLVNEYIFKEPIKSKGKISIENLYNIFTEEPFGLNEKDAENLARYLIEDNQEEMIQFRKTMEAENLLVKSRVRFVIGKVKIFTHEEEEKLFQEIVEKVKKYGDGLYYQLTLNGDVKKTLKVTKDQVIRAMQYIDMELNKNQSEYYFLKLFEKTQDPNKFNLDDCTKIFVH